MKKYVNVKIMLPSKRRSFDWVVSTPVAIMLAIFMLIFFAGALYNFLGFSKTVYLNTKLYVTKAENEKLIKNMSYYKGNLKKFDKELKKLQEVCDNVLILNALPPLFKERKDINMGGVGITNRKELNRVDKEITNLNISFSQIELKMNMLKTGFYKVIEKAEASVKKWEHVPTIWPVDGWISSPFGWRISPFGGKKEFHTGLDISNLPGTPIKVTANGYVVYSGWLGPYGNVIIVEHGFGYETRYGHLKKRLVKKGAYVKKGAVIGLLGNTGRSTGPHLHYEVIHNGKVENPMKYLIPEENKVLGRITYLNGK